MGRDLAAVALAIVSTKEPEHFRTTPGGYFHGMVAKAKAGELHLERTVWALRRASSRNTSGAGEGTAIAGTGSRPCRRSWPMRGTSPFARGHGEDLDLSRSLRPTPALQGKGFALAAVSPSFADC